MNEIWVRNVYTTEMFLIRDLTKQKPLCKDSAVYFLRILPFFAYVCSILSEIPGQINQFMIRNNYILNTTAWNLPLIFVKIICSVNNLWQNSLYWFNTLVLGIRLCVAWFSSRVYLPLWRRFASKSRRENINYQSRYDPSVF